MKYITNILRVFVGLLFIFSGLIKSNDPTGFSYKLDEYFSVFAEELEADQDSLTVSVSTLDGTFSNTVVLSANSSTYPIAISTTPWQKIELGNNAYTHVSEASVNLNGKEVFATTVEAQDSNEVVLQANLSYAVGLNKIGSKELTFASFDVLDKTVDVDISSYLKPNPATVGFLQSMRPYALALAIFLCVLEIVLGLALLIGWSPKFVVTALVLLIIFFTFLTWYSAYFNKVTDCGCFGDAIKLTPWESFYKDVILSVSIFFIAIGIKHIKPIFSSPFAVKMLTVFTLMSVGFSLYCWHYLPVKNFLKFKQGNNIKNLAVVPDDAPSDVYENIFIYAKDGVEEEFNISEMTGRDLKAEGYTFVDRKDKLISKGYEPEIHDFKIMDESRDNDYADDFFANDSTRKILIVINEVENANADAMQDLKEIIKTCKTEGIAIYPLTASASEKVDAFRHKHQLDIPFYYGDKTNLKSIIRSNPGLVLFEGNVVEKNWPSTRLPSVKRFLKKVGP